MPNLEKATLLAVKKDSADPLDGAKPIPVQFNPSSLHFTLASASDSGKTPARPDEQHLGSGNVTVTLDLHFDTADEGSTDTPVSVRTKTAEVAKFMLPASGSSGPPPRVRFSWGTSSSSASWGRTTEDLDLFSPQGIPLRAKVAVSIRGQNPERAANKTGPGAKSAAGATKPGAFGGAPGTIGFGASLSVGASLGVSAGLGVGVSLEAGLSLGDRTGVAIGGESVAEFAARMGADPSAWRGVAAGLDSTISLPAGAEIDFSSNLSANVGVGTAVGVGSDASATIEASVGLGGESAAPARAGAAPGTGAGMALAAAGGVQEALASTQVASATSRGRRRQAGLRAPCAGGGHGPRRGARPGLGAAAADAVARRRASRRGGAVGRSPGAAAAPGRRAGHLLRLRRPAAPGRHRCGREPRGRARRRHRARRPRASRRRRAGDAGSDARAVARPALGRRRPERRQHRPGPPPAALPVWLRRRRGLWLRGRLRMTVRVDELTTDVTVEGNAGASGGAAGTPPPSWARFEALRALQERVARDAARTSAEDYSD